LLQKSGKQEQSINTELTPRRKKARPKKISTKRTLFADDTNSEKNTQPDSITTLLTEKIAAHINEHIPLEAEVNKQDTQPVNNTLDSLEIDLLSDSSRVDDIIKSISQDKDLENLFDEIIPHDLDQIVSPNSHLKLKKVPSASPNIIDKMILNNDSNDADDVASKKRKLSIDAPSPVKTPLQNMDVEEFLSKLNYDNSNSN